MSTVDNNGDFTVTLTQQDEDIWKIFAQHIIYDFFQAYPNSNPDGTLFNNYTIVFGRKDPTTQLRDYANPETFIVDEYPNTNISTALIELLDNKI